MAIWEKKKKERVLFRLLAAVLSYKNVRCIYQINVILLLIERKCWIIETFDICSLKVTVDRIVSRLSNDKIIRIKIFN